MTEVEAVELARRIEQFWHARGYPHIAARPLQTNFVLKNKRSASQGGTQRSARPPQRELEIMQIVEAARRHAEIDAELRRKHDARREAACRIREWFYRELPNMHPQPNQRPDSHLEPLIGLPLLAKKGREEVFKLMAGDAELAERLSKKIGVPLAECIKAIAEVNALNTPSYEGGLMIQKGAKVTKTKPEKAAEKLAKMARDQMRKAFGDRPPQIVQRAVAALLIADNDYRTHPNEFSKAALARANEHCRRIIAIAQAPRLGPTGSAIGSGAQLLVGRR